MPKIPRISEAEWQVMKILWEKSPATANEVIEKMVPQSNWSPKTIRTLINRLVSKKALTYSKEGREYSYYPLVAEDECAKAESLSFLRRVYGGTLKPMLAHFLETESLTPEEVEELKRLLDKKGK